MGVEPNSPEFHPGRIPQCYSAICGRSIPTQRPAQIWRKAEVLILTPFGAHRFRAEPGTPVRLTFQIWRRADHSKITPFGAIRFQGGAGAPAG
jgi:hypothetical protein